MPSEQLSLFGSVPTVASDRLFFATYPDAKAGVALAERASDCGARLGIRRPPVKPGLLHVTLNHLGDHHGLPPPLVQSAKEAGSNLHAKPFDVTFDRAGGFRKPFVLQGGEGLDDLRAFQRMLGQAMTWAGLGRRVENDFAPHITLFYGEDGATTFPIEPVTWTVTEFVLVHSLIGEGRHVPLARWPLLG